MLDIGSQWIRGDLHFHTPSSYDYKNKSLTNKEIIDTLINQNINIVAITDHFIIDAKRIEELIKLSNNRITILPGIEVRTELGGKDQIHLTAVFPNVNIGDLRTKINGTLKMTPSDIKAKGGYDKFYVNYEVAIKIFAEVEGLIFVHAGKKSNSIETISNSDLYKQIQKKDMIKKIHGLDVASKDDEENYKNVVFKNIKRNLAVIISSDNHDIKKYEVKEKCWFKCKPTFNGLKRAVNCNENRIYIGDAPPQLISQTKNPAKFIKRISINKKKNKELDEKWFDVEIPLNQGLVAIIGSQGSGKSALLDIVAQCGNSKLSSNYSFLNPKRFCNPDKKRHEFFEASLEFCDGTINKINTLEPIHSPEKETAISYIPQRYFVEICDEQNKDQFIVQLKNIVYSNIPDENRMGQDTFDNLFQYLHKTEIKKRQKLLDRLGKLNKEIVRLQKSISKEKQSEFHSEQENLNRELQSIKIPKKVEKPAGKKSQSLTKLDQSIDKKTQNFEALNNTIKQVNKNIVDGNELINDIKTLNLEVEEKIKEYKEKSDSLGIKIYSDNRDFKINFSLGINKIEKYINNQKLIFSKSDQNRKELKEEIEVLTNEKNKIIKEFDTEQQNYQNYLQELKEVEERKKNLEGDEKTPGTLKFIQNELKKIRDLYPKKIYENLQKRNILFKEIFQSITDEKDILTDLSKYSQEKTNNSKIITDKFKIKYGVKLSIRDFSTKLIEFIDIRKSAFSSNASAHIEINKKIAEFKSNFEDIDLLAFVEETIENIKRKKDLVDILINPNIIEDFYNFIYSQEYLVPEYTLELENRDISILSPGEKGALLIIHYLLVDNDKRPLLIDQPEQSLANDSVFKLLAPCFLQAKESRQIILVTHNPNLAVVCDAEQIIIANINKKNRNEILYESGAQEDPYINKEILRILEGTKPAFQKREEGYIELQIESE